MGFFYVSDGVEFTPVSFDGEDWLRSWVHTLALGDALNANTGSRPNVTGATADLGNDGRDYRETYEGFPDRRILAAHENHPYWVAEPLSDNTASGVTLTYTLSLLPGAASGGMAADATAQGVTLTYSTALIAGSATASSQAAGAVLTEVLSLIAGEASASVDATASGVTATQTLSFVAGEAQADSEAQGATLTATYSLIPGAASGGVSPDATAAGATLSYAYTLLAGIASGEIAPVVIRRGDDGGYLARERFWAKKAEEWLEAKLEQLPRLAKKPKAKRVAAIEVYENDAADYLADFPEYAPRIDAVTALMEGLLQPYTDYAALILAIEAQQAQIEAHKRARRRARDIEAILLLDA